MTSLSTRLLLQPDSVNVCQVVDRCRRQYQVLPRSAWSARREIRRTQDRMQTPGARQVPVPAITPNETRYRAMCAAAAFATNLSRPLTVSASSIPNGAMTVNLYLISESSVERLPLTPCVSNREDAANLFSDIYSAELMKSEARHANVIPARLFFGFFFSR